MIALVEDLIAAMQKYDKAFNPNPSKCLGRINRDIRFAKDKTPYNQHFFAHITKGTKEAPLPGIAFRFGGRDGGIMGGFYKPSKEQLGQIRNNISTDTKTFQKLITNKNFVKHFGRIRGEAYKRVPPELKATFEIESLVANKEFYYVSEKKASFVTTENLLEEIMSHWLAAKPLNDFLS